MNVAGALARSVRNDGTPDVELVARLLIEAASTRAALATAGEQESDGDQTSFFTAVGISVEQVASRLIDPRFVELARPLALNNFISSGAAGIPLLTEDEVDKFLTDVAERDPGYRDLWLELAPIDDSNKSWVAYPQSAWMSLEFHLILPVAQDGEYTRFLTLDPGVEVMMKTTRAPQVMKGLGCDPGITGSGETLREVCLSATCSSPCKESWQLRRGKARLSGCDC